MSILQIPLPPCPDRWTHHDDKCVFQTKTAVPGSQIESVCEDLYPAAQPVSSHSLEMDNFLCDFSDYFCGDVWLGIHRNQDDAWQWYDGSPMDYTDWISPPHDDQDCALLSSLGDSVTLGWYAFNCSSSWTVFCQLPEYGQRSDDLENVGELNLR